MTLMHLRSAQWPNVHLRLDGSGVTSANPAGGGIVNGQFGAGPYETFYRETAQDGTVSFRSAQFSNVYLRMDGQNVTRPTDGGLGTVNASYGIEDAKEKFFVLANEDSTVSLKAASAPQAFLRMDGSSVKAPVGPGGGVVNGQFFIGPYEKFVLCPAMIDTQASSALDHLAAAYPSEAAQLNAHRQQIISACCFPFNAGTPPQVSHVVLSPAASQSRATSLTWTPCQSAIFDVVYDVVGLTLSLIGLRIDQQLRTTLSNALREARDIESVREDASLLLGHFRSYDNLRASQRFYSIMNRLFTSYDLPRMIWDWMKNNMGWWDWAKAAVTTFVTLVAWFASEGVALVAEVVLVIFGFAGLKDDLTKMGAACNI